MEDFLSLSVYVSYQNNRMFRECKERRGKLLEIILVLRFL